MVVVVASGDALLPSSKWTTCAKLFDMFLINSVINAAEAGLYSVSPTADGKLGCLLAFRS